MSTERGFFDTDVTDSFVESLDDLTFSELVTILRDNFNNEYHQLNKITKSNHQLQS